MAVKEGAAGVSGWGGKGGWKIRVRISYLCVLFGLGHQSSMGCIGKRGFLI
jgi:hypothetical protein